MVRTKLLSYSLLLVIMIACTPKATKYFNKGKKQYEQAEYQFAIENFQQALSKGASSGDCNYYIAESYRRSNRIAEAEKFYSKAIEAKINEEDAYFYYGFALKSVGNYEGAASQLNNYIKIGTNFDMINRAKNELNNLAVLNDIVAKKSYYTVENIAGLNTEEAEYSPYFYNNKLYFTTSRGAQKMHAANGTGFTDIYEFIFDGLGKFTGQSKRLPEQINTDDAHEASIIFSKDGKMVVFSRGNNGAKKGAKDVDIYMSLLQADGTWGEAVLLKINDPNAWDSSPAFSADGKTLYFASNREGGNGGVDIYKSTIDANGEWGNVTNLGTPINTRGNDLFPYENAEGVLYFSSDGHPSLGSLDLFMVKKDGKKTTIENLGKPVNSSFDDFAIFYKDSITGFFSSNRPEGKGDDDIYEFVDKSKMRFAHYFIDGDVFGKDNTAQFILPGSSIYILNEEKDTVVTLTADEKGEFKTELNPETRYTIMASKEGFLKQELELFIEKVAYKDLKAGDNDIVKEVKLVLPKKEVNIIVEIDNIYYDYDKWDIRADAAIELFKVVKLLEDNPDITIELGSHTDERGSATYNRNLAQKRAQSAVNYIISKGIDKSRITAKGYGEDKPIIKNAQTEEDHQKNRRTEFKITGVLDPKLQIKNKGTQTQ